MFVAFNHTIFKLVITWILKENSVFQSSVSDFHSVKTSLTKMFFWCEWGMMKKYIYIYKYCEIANFVNFYQFLYFHIANLKLSPYKLQKS